MNWFFNVFNFTFVNCDLYMKQNLIWYCICFHYWLILFSSVQFNSVRFSRSVMSDSLWLHEPQHTRPPCPSPTPRVHPNPCPLSWWCHPTILSSVVHFSSCPQSFPGRGSFQMSHIFASGGQSIGVSFHIQFSSVQSLSHVRLFVTPWTAACQASLPITNSWSLFRLMCIESCHEIGRASCRERV